MITQVTLETNSIISLEQGRPQAPFIKELITLHEAGTIALRVVGISASERQKDGKIAPNYAQFKQLLERVGLGDAKVLCPPAYFGITYFDASFFGTRAGIILETEIHRILWPNLPFHFQQFERSADKSNPAWMWKWKNPKCDTLALWSHIWYGGGIFVSDDDVFHQQTKKPALLDLAGGDIVRTSTVKERLYDGAEITPVPEDVSKLLRNTAMRIDPHQVPREFRIFWERRHQPSASPTADSQNAKYMRIGDNNRK